MIREIALSSTAFLVLISLIFHDVFYRRLPNKLVGVFFILFFLYAFLCEFSFDRFLENVAIFFVTFFVILIFYLLRFVGGGDVKLWSVVMLWGGIDYAWSVIFIVTFVGGVMAVVGLIAWYLLRIMPSSFLRPVWCVLTVDRGVPYGVGLSLAGMFVVYMQLQTCLGAT